MVQSKPCWMASGTAEHKNNDISTIQMLIFFCPTMPPSIADLVPGDQDEESIHYIKHDKEERRSPFLTVTPCNFQCT